jgi:hypothetical protein
MVTPKDNIPETTLNILMTGRCKTVSGKSTLTLNFARNDDGDRFVRIYSNTNNGYFSAEWLALQDVLTILENQQGGSFTSLVLHELFEGKSVNSPSFLTAILLHEKVVKREEGKSRKYIYNGPDALLAKLEKAGLAKAAKPVKKKAARRKA